MEKETCRPLLEARGSGDDEYENLFVRHPAKRSWTLQLSLAANIALVILVSALGMALLTGHRRKGYEGLYSPAQHVVEYETKVFRSGLHGDMTEYQGSSAEVLERWEALYNEIGMTQIDRDLAMKLPNATAPTSYDHSQYLVELDVFHTLHCLNMLRKRIYPDVYPPDEDDDTVYHLEHCVESIRQSLQCSSDISTIYWEWSEKQQKMMGNLQTTHTCRNFEKIQQWAREHTTRQETDFLQYVPGSPLRSE